jgi:hypothetical protein
MYRKRRNRLHRRRRAALAVGSAAVLALAIGIPTFASAQTANLIGQTGASGGSGSGSSSGTATADPNAGVPPTYTPPLHGTNPHGQGTNAVVDIQPSDTNPYTGDPSTDDPPTGEDIIVGESRGEQGASGYNGRVTLLWLFGNPIVQVTSNPGESNEGPLDPIQTQLLDQICEGSDGQACITLLRMHSDSTGSSSTNAFELLGVHLGNGPNGDEGLNLDVLKSNGNISQDGSGCQTAHGDSTGVKLGAGGNPIVDALEADSTSNCGGSVQQSDQFLALGGNGLPLFAAGCADGSDPANDNTVFDDLSPLLAQVCNASDVNNGQTDAPYGVREAVTLFVLISGDSSLLKVTGGAAESHVVASGGTGGPPGGPGIGTQGTKGAGGKGGGQGGNAGGNGGGGAGGGAGAGAGAAAGNAGAGNGNLAFTGADLFVLGLIGGALILGGLALTTMAGRSHRQTV